ncbi:50S ribosomal protein L5 [archaeon]|nr:50S ribosomal protein L5 [archaeon]|tara:strand:+ start:389 stop:934 length:546 start_codon:yes stop_codon:yes gene_type:complete
MESQHQNKMKQEQVEKITLNIGVGSPGDKLTKAKKLLEVISGSKAVETKTMKRIPTWGLRPNLAIGVKVTLRGEKAEKLLIRLFSSLDNKLNIKNFDDYGNFSFGIKEYIDIPDVEYNPDFGMIGLEAAVTLERPGFSIKKRMKKTKIPFRHKIKKQEAMDFIKSKFKIEIVEEEDQNDLQ